MQISWLICWRVWSERASIPLQIVLTATAYVWFMLSALYDFCKYFLIIFVKTVCEVPRKDFQLLSLQPNDCLTTFQLHHSGKLRNYDNSRPSPTEEACNVSFEQSAHSYDVRWDCLEKEHRTFIRLARKTHVCKKNQLHQTEMVRIMHGTSTSQNSSFPDQESFRNVNWS